MVEVGEKAPDLTLLSDPEGKVLDLYGVWKQRSLCGRKFMGTEKTRAKTCQGSSPSIPHLT